MLSDRVGAVGLAAGLTMMIISRKRSRLRIVELENLGGHQASGTAGHRPRESPRGRRIFWMTWTAGRVTKSPEPGCASNGTCQPSPRHVPGHGSGWRWLAELSRKPGPRGLFLPLSESRCRISQAVPSGVAVCLPRS